jgi:chorismate mutase
MNAPARKTADDIPSVHLELKRLRDSIDNLDAALVHILAERFKYTQAVGVLKASNHLPPRDAGREATQIARLRCLSLEAHLDPTFAEKFLRFIVQEVIRHHEAMSVSADAGRPVVSEPPGSGTASISSN